MSDTITKVMSRPKKDRIGTEYGRLRIVAYAYATLNDGDITPVHHYECECACGTRLTIRINNLMSGNTKSCGCLKKEANKRLKTKKVKAS